MPRELIPERRNLPNKPLAEAIFELRWQLKSPQPGFEHDPGYRFLLGRFWELVHAEYPEGVQLPTFDIPDQLATNTVTYQFRVRPDSWPLIQLGPGVLTVNDTQGYTWESFRPRIISAVKNLFQAYPSSIAPVIPNLVQVRYINSLPLDGESPITYLRAQLHIDVAVDKLLFETPETADRPSGLSLQLAFPLETPQGVGRLAFSSGQRDNKPALVWEILIASTGPQVPRDPDSFGPWADAAHAVVDKWFFALSRGALLEEFERPK